MGIGEVMLFMWLFAIIGYLACRVAYNQGRKSKWEEMCTEYICIHKSVCIQEKKQETKQETKDIKKEKKHLTNPTKKAKIKKVVKHAKKQAK